MRWMLRLGTILVLVVLSSSMLLADDFTLTKSEAEENCAGTVSPAPRSVDADRNIFIRVWPPSISTSWSCSAGFGRISDEESADDLTFHFKFTEPGP